MSQPWTPSFVYGTTTLALSLPMLPPTYPVSSVGGRRVSAAGVPAAYRVRTDRLLGVTLRFYEHEWPEVEAMILAAQLAIPVTFRPDRHGLVDTREFEVYLETPAAGATWEPVRDPQFLDAFRLDTTWRRVDGGGWDFEWDGDPRES